MIINAKIVADSINEFGNRLTTMEIIMPRIVLAEFNTHRVFSRNSASSRAIPFKRMVKMVQDNPFIPIAWQKEHTGMQGTEYLSEKQAENAKIVWLQARDAAVHSAERLNLDLGKDFFPPVTKQLCNRLLEPFMYHKVIVTATEWENFFKLRCPQYTFNPEIGYKRSKKDMLIAVKEQYKKDGIGDSVFEELSSEPILWWLKSNDSQAEIHIQAVAEAMWDAMNESTPTLLRAGEWHIPYGEDLKTASITNSVAEIVLGKKEGIKYINDIQVKIATARCARVSYTTVGDDGKIVINDYAKDLILHDRLAESGHWSPFEHCAIAETNTNFYANFKGWKQYRTFLEN